MRFQSIVGTGLGVLTMLLACLSSVSSAQPSSGGWMAGVGRADITPKGPLWLAGYGSRDHASEGTLQPIWVKSLALKDEEGKTVVLVTSDILGFPKGMSDAIRDRLQKELGLAREQIILNSSHTHSGPVLRDSLYPIYPLNEQEIARIEEYSKGFEEHVFGAVRDALKSLAPAKLSAGNGICRFAVNRRENKEAAILDAFALKGPSDHAVPVLKVEREDGSLLAAVFGYACHNTTLCEYAWCGDYAGFAQSELETAHPGTTAMFFEGCGADQNPLPRRSVAIAKQYGRTLAAAVEQVLEDPMRSLAPAIRTAYIEVELALTTPPTREELAKIIEGEASVFHKRAAKQFLADLDQGKPLRTTYPYPVQMWRLGDQTIVALGGEIVIDYTVFIKQLLGRETFVMGYSNDLMSYIPSLRVLKEGGYEGRDAQVYYLMPSAYAEDVEDRIMAAVRDLAGKVGVPMKNTGK